MRDPRRLGRVRARRRRRARRQPRRRASHVKFKEKYELPFTLLADTEHATAEDYGVWVEKSYAGKTYMGVERSTFVIDADGNVAKELRRVKPDTHADDVLAALASSEPRSLSRRSSPRRSSGSSREAGGSVGAEVERLSAAYRGEDRARAASSRAAVAAYLAYRAPATYAAAAAVFRQVQRAATGLDAAFAARRRRWAGRRSLGGSRLPGRRSSS